MEHGRRRHGYRFVAWLARETAASDGADGCGGRQRWGTEAEALLIYEGWHAQTPSGWQRSPRASVLVQTTSSMEADGRQRSLFSWAEFMADETSRSGLPGTQLGWGVPCRRG